MRPRRVLVFFRAAGGGEMIVRVGDVLEIAFSRSSWSTA